MYSFVTLAFRVDMTRMYGRGGFPLYWALNWLSMTALGLIMVSSCVIVGRGMLADQLHFTIRRRPCCG